MNFQASRDLGRAFITKTIHSPAVCQYNVLFLCSRLCGFVYWFLLSKQTRDFIPHSSLQAGVCSLSILKQFSAFYRPKIITDFILDSFYTCLPMKPLTVRGCMTTEIISCGSSLFLAWDQASESFWYSGASKAVPRVGVISHPQLGQKVMSIQIPEYSSVGVRKAAP